MGAGLDWKTSLQELSALHALGVPEYVIEATGPDHMKSFTAQVRVADRLYGHGVGRSKKEAEQQAAETAYREIDEAARPRRSRRSPTRTPSPSPSTTTRPLVPELPEVEVVRRGLEAHAVGETITARRGAAPPSGTP